MLSGHPHHLLVLKANQQARISVLPPTNALQQPIGVSTQSQEPFWWEQFRKSYTQHQYQHWWSEEKTVPLHMWVQSPRHVFLVHISIILLFFFSPQPGTNLKALQTPPAIPSHQRSEWPADHLDVLYQKAGNVLFAWPSVPVNSFQSCSLAHTGRA